MESTLCVSAAEPAVLARSRALSRQFTNRAHSFLLPSQLATRLVVSSHKLPLLTSSIFSSSSSSSSSSVPLRGLCAAAPLVRRRLECVSNSEAAFGTAGGGSGGEGAGDGDGSSNGPEEDMAVLSSDVIILDVGGMTCDGCAASVKRILESQPQVSSATVNLTTGTAMVWPLSEAKVALNWQKQLGETLAKHTTNCGFKSNLRGQEAIEGDISP